MRRRHATLIAVVWMLIAVAGCGSGSGRSDTAGAAPTRTSAASRPADDARFFSPDSVWNRPLPANAPIASDSRRLVTALQTQVRRSGTWINTYEYSVPIVTVGRRQQPVRVHLDVRYAPLAHDFARVPVPNDARPAAGTDRHLVVWQPSTDTMWEFWHMERRSDGWHARWGAKIAHTSRSHGVVQAPEGATASGLALAGGLMTMHELQRGRIDHALAFALSAARAGVVAAPANRTDGTPSRPASIPLGTHFRLDPDVDVDALGLPPTTRAIAHALQRYGMIARDTSGASVTFYAQAPPPGQGGAYRRAFGGAYPNQLLARIPWDRMQVVRAPVHLVRGPGG
jgi:hypothetical protein